MAEENLRKPKIGTGSSGLLSPDGGRPVRIREITVEFEGIPGTSPGGIGEPKKPMIVWYLEHYTATIDEKEVDKVDDANGQAIVNNATHLVHSIGLDPENKKAYFTIG